MLATNRAFGRVAMGAFAIAVVAACTPTSKEPPLKLAVAPSAPASAPASASPPPGVPPARADAAAAPAPPEAGEPADACDARGGTAKKTELTCADRKAWYAKLKWPSECEEAYDATAIHGSPAIDFHSIATSRYVVAIACTLGAYQGYSVFVLYDEVRDVGTLIKFRTYRVPRDNVLEPRTDTELWGNTEWDDTKKELSVHNRHRGPGDCGSFARYAMRTGIPAVTEMRVQSVCDGKTTDPSQWPRVRAP